MIINSCQFNRCFFPRGYHISISVSLLHTRAWGGTVLIYLFIIAFFATPIKHIRGPWNQAMYFLGVAKKNDYSAAYIYRHYGSYFCPCDVSTLPWSKCMVGYSISVYILHLDLQQRMSSLFTEPL